MMTSSRPFRSLLMALACAALAYVPPLIYETATSAWRFARKMFAIVVEFPAAAVSHALSLFAPTGVFAVALQRLEDAVMTAYKAWRAGSGDDKHYRAPGSWTRCAST